MEHLLSYLEKRMNCFNFLMKYFARDSLPYSVVNGDTAVTRDIKLDNLPSYEALRGSFNNIDTDTENNRVVVELSPNVHAEETIEKFNKARASETGPRYNFYFIRGISG